MKITVNIEASSIEEYMQAIQALAAGYTVGNAKMQVEPDEIKVSEEKPKRRTTTKQERVTEAQKPVSTPEMKMEAETTDEIMEAAEAYAEELIKSDKAEEVLKANGNPQNTAVSFVDVKLRAKQIANLPDGKADVKFILEKLGAASLSKLKEEQYNDFMDLCEYVEKTPKEEKDSTPTDNVPESNEQASEEMETKEDSGETKEVTLEMIRGKAKQLAVAGYKAEIQQILKTYNAPSLTKIKKEDYNGFYAAMVLING